jgi:hypothetical protein
VTYEGLNCQAFSSWFSAVYQDIFKSSIGPSFTLPDGVSWKAGYPEALFGCDWAFVVDYALISECYNCDDTPHQNVGDGIQSTRQRSKYRIMILTCPDGDESAAITDISDDALDGGNTVIESASVPDDCEGGKFASTPWLDFFPDPEPVCNEFP